MTYIYFDTETLDWFNQPGWERLSRDEQIGRMRFGCGATISSSPQVAWEWDDPVKMARHLMSSSNWATLVGWNVISFDMPILWRYMEKVEVGKQEGWQRWERWQRMRVFDLMDFIRQATSENPSFCGNRGGRWYSLESISIANLGRGKTGDGLQAVKWLLDGEREKAIEYCLNDVRLTRDIHQLAMEEGLLLPARTERGEQGDLRFFLDPDGRVFIDQEKKQ